MSWLGNVDTWFSNFCSGITGNVECYRMKREVASSMVERGVAERVRLTQAYEKKRDELQKQHDAVKAALLEHKSKVSLSFDRSGRGFGNLFTQNVSKGF